MPVCFPYEFTLLSNCAFVLAVPAAVCFPYEFTLLSNPICADSRHGKFVSPTNLHCSQTGRKFLRMKTCLFPLQIYTALKPAFRSCLILGCLFPLQIYTALKPWQEFADFIQSLFPLQIYTALKPYFWGCPTHNVCFPYKFTLLSNLGVNITDLFEFVSPTNLHCSQTVSVCVCLGICLFPLRIYTALKHKSVDPGSDTCLFPLRIYTALKLKTYHREVP